MKELKTNVMRILEKENIPYTAHEYPHGKDAVDGVTVASLLGQNPDYVFKTLVTKGGGRDYYVFVVPVAEERRCRPGGGERGTAGAGGKVCLEGDGENAGIGHVRAVDRYSAGGRPGVDGENCVREPREGGYFERRRRAFRGVGGIHKRIRHVWVCAECMCRHQYKQRKRANCSGMS